MKHICLFTATGAENLGDELITLCEIQNFQRKFPNIKITLFSHDIDRTKRFLISQGVGMENIHIYEYFPNALKRQPIRNIKLLLNTFYQLWKCEEVYVGGGGLLYSKKEEWHSPLKLWWMRATITKILKKPLTYLSLWISADSHEIWNYMSGLFSQSTITVRDKKSQDIVWGLGYNAEILPDPVFTYAGEKWTSKTIGIALRKGFLEQGVILDICKKLISLGYNILLLPHSLHPTDENSHDGYYLQDFLLPWIRTTQSIEQTLAWYTTCHMVISMRLHSMILSITHGIPFIGVSYSDKTASVLQAVEWEYSFDKNVDSRSIIDAVQKIETDYKELETKLQKYREQKKDEYTRFFDKNIWK